MRWGLAVALLVLAGCKKDQPVPVFLHVDSVRVYEADGTSVAAHGVNTVWLTAEGRLLGAFEVPFVFPFFCSAGAGAASLMFRGGVKLNGLSAYRILHPVLRSYSTSVSCLPGDTVKVVPSFYYVEDSFIAVLWRNSADTSPGFTLLQGTGQLTLQSDTVVEGCCALRVAPASLVSLISTQALDSTVSVIPPVLLELSYLSYDTFGVGVSLSLPGNPTEYYTIVHVYPVSRWNTIYIDLTDYVIYNPDALINIYITARHTLYLDRMQVVAAR